MLRFIYSLVLYVSPLNGELHPFDAKKITEAPEAPGAHTGQGTFDLSFFEGKASPSGNEPLAALDGAAKSFLGAAGYLTRRLSLLAIIIALILGIVALVSEKTVNGRVRAKENLSRILLGATLFFSVAGIVLFIISAAERI